jgi:hypothetical protein
MKWLHRLIENKRPDWIANRGFAWEVWTTRWFGVSVTLRYRSDESFEQPAECNRLTVTLEGEYLRHFEVPRTGDNEPAMPLPKDTYVYGNEFGLWGCRTLHRGEVFYEAQGRRGGVELLDARNQGERMVDFANWMTHGEVIFDSDRVVLLLTICWGPGWR